MSFGGDRSLNSKEPTPTRQEGTMPTTKTQVNKVATVIVPVADQEAMLEFYAGKLGLEKRVDVPFGNGERWIEVAPGDAVTTIAIAPPGPGGSTGNRETGISLQADDIDAYHAELKEAGVDVDPEVSHMGDPVPPMFWLRDPEGNRLLVVQ
jgi:predicted enzyme related to lactoylglutathione lyase